MKKYLLILILIASSLFVCGQDVNLITEQSVSRVIQSLSADEMMGRPASRPELMEKATAFIENEFKEIGLQPLDGLSGFRQEFQKGTVKTIASNLIVDGQTVPASNYFIVSEDAEINVPSNFKIVTLSTAPSNMSDDQYFFSTAFQAIGDATPTVVVVGIRYMTAFSRLRERFESRYTTGKKGVTVFVLGSKAPGNCALTAKQEVKTITMTNVVGQIKGSSLPAEMVVFSGHYDHLGIERANSQGDSIANGADDDASGTTAVIELARYFKNAKANNRTLIFVAFTAEEIGGFGSKYFSEQVNPDKVIAMFNIEMIGKASKWGQNSAFITGFKRSNFGKILQKNLKGTPFKFKPDPYPEQDLFYRSDNATLARLGVPAHTISTDQIDIDKYYHTVDDEFQTLDVANIVATIRAIALSSRSIVDGKDTPKRIDKTTVR
jgi:Zn-dependent M28 family amino/carboxypeptidase